MKHSIRFNFAFTYITLMTFTLLCCFLVNRFFLEKYYLNRKQDSLQEVYSYLNMNFDWESIKAQMEESGNSANLYEYREQDSADTVTETVYEASDNELQRICTKNNISFLVLDSTGAVLKASMYNVDILKRQLLEDIFFYNSEDMYPGRILYATDNYVKILSKDKFIGTDFIEMWGFLDGGEIFILRTPVESIREGSRIATRFLAYIGLAAIFLGAIITYSISSRITKPIRELTIISEKMAKLDFNTHYSKGEDNEIGRLGENMNTLSTALESTISELKSANLSLKRDVEKKEKIDNMRREFLSNVSHELKTPIALIQGYAEGLTESVNDDENRDFYCEVIIDEAKRMNKLVQSLLNLEDMELGIETPVMERFDISELIDNVIQSMDILIKQKDIDIRNDSGSGVYIWADMARCEDIFRNYMSNAINHIGGDKVLHIKAQPGEDTVRISVFNTGAPIPEENLPHIWEKFYKVDKARTREYGGSGVGLSIVKAACESMNMNYGVQNYENGVEFWFEASIKAL